MTQLTLSAKALFLPLKTRFKQASSVRDHGESIWVEAHRNGKTGLGEGCPRIYVTGEEVEPGLQWLTSKLPEITATCISFESLKAWVEFNRHEIDRHPAAWCGVELALLDLFAQESEQRVEELLNIDGPESTHIYTAIIGDDLRPKFEEMLQRYLAGAFTDFKVKLSGNIEEDRWKLLTLQSQLEAAGIATPRIRLDANNHWSGASQKAIDHLWALRAHYFAIEEPVAPRQALELSQISTALDKPVILDESLLQLTDLSAYDNLPGQFIANLKVSRVGGLLRCLELIAELHRREWPIIIGAHVGETSVLTRAGMLAATAARHALIAQEGGYGTLLLERDLVKPSLQFGKAGKLETASLGPLGWGLGKIVL